MSSLNSLRWRFTSRVHATHAPQNGCEPLILLSRDSFLLSFDLPSFCLLAWDPAVPCEGDGDVAGVVTPLVRGGAQVLHGDQVVELSVQLEVQEREEEGEDGEGQIKVESERGELKERRTWMTMRMI